MAYGKSVVTWPMTSRDPERSNSWLENALSAISRKQLEMLATVANYYLVCCEAVRWAILATAWLLASFPFSINCGRFLCCLREMQRDRSKITNFRYRDIAYMFWSVGNSRNKRIQYAWCWLLRLLETATAKMSNTKLKPFKPFAGNIIASWLLAVR